MADQLGHLYLAPWEAIPRDASLKGSLPTFTRLNICLLNNVFTQVSSCIYTFKDMVSNDKLMRLDHNRIDHLR